MPASAPVQVQVPLVSPLQNIETYSQEQKLKHVTIVGLSVSSLINMHCLGADAPTSNDAEGCTKEEAQYTWVFGNGQKRIVHGDTVGIHEGGGLMFMNCFKIFSETPKKSLRSLRGR